MGGEAGVWALTTGPAENTIKQKRSLKGFIIFRQIIMDKYTKISRFQMKPKITNTISYFKCKIMKYSYLEGKYKAC